MAITGRMIGKQICDALGIDANGCCSLVIRIDPKEVVTVEAKFHISNVLLLSVCETIEQKEFVLVSREEWEKDNATKRA